MLQNDLLSPDVFEYSEVLPADSVVTPVVELINNSIALRNEINNWGFMLFVICFFIIVVIVSGKNKLLSYMVSGLFKNKERHSMFLETLTNETINKLLLSFQTILLISIIFYCYATHNHFLLASSSFKQMVLFLGTSQLLLIVFVFYKFLTYLLIGTIFFKKETVNQWNDDFFSLISLNGIILFFPILIFFYVEKAFPFCIYFMVFYLFLNMTFIFYKIYVLFFQGKQRLLYFILYLCAQEIIPLYLVYHGFVYLIAQKDTIWM